MPQSCFGLALCRGLDEAGHHFCRLQLLWCTLGRGRLLHLPWESFLESWLAQRFSSLSSSEVILIHRFIHG